MLSDEFSQVESELKEIFRLLEETSNLAERHLLLQDCQMLLGLASRVIKSHSEYVDKLMRRLNEKALRIDSLRQRVARLERPAVRRHGRRRVKPSV